MEKIRSKGALQTSDVVQALSLITECHPEVFWVLSNGDPRLEEGDLKDGCSVALWHPNLREAIHHVDPHSFSLAMAEVISRLDRRLAEEVGEVGV